MPSTTTRTLLVYPLPALVVAALWLRLERPAEVGPALGLAVLALVPALAPSLRLRVAALFVVSLAALGVAFDLAPQRHPAGTASRFADGFLDFYDVRVPFDPRVHAAMHGTILVAVFGFCAALALAVAARRAPAAVLVLLVGAGWPATLLAGGNEIGRGALLLLATLVLLVGLSRRPTFAAAVPAALALAVLAAGAASSPAVAKRELVSWQRWDFYDRPDDPVAVSFVWTSQYDGIHWPKKKTVVLEVKAPSRALYWRAATLDSYDNDRWLEAAPRAGADPGLPRAAADLANQLRTEVKVEALADNHLVGATEPVRFGAGDAPLLYTGEGVALIPSGLTRGFTYTVWSYAPNPTARRLIRSRPLYPPALIRPGGFLDLTPGVAAPPFGARGRGERLRELLDAHSELYAYRPLAAAALRVAGRAKSPYAAAIGLESWLRFRGGFIYSNRGYETTAPPLVGFVVQTKRGYCQYFAGAMALMLRYLGVPARVAVGFTSGEYNPKRKTWTVTDHDAHAWVEAWFRGYGWLPFDPTPGRGRLGSAYSASAPTFLARTSAKLLSALGLGDPADIALQGSFREPGGHARPGLGSDASAAGGGGAASAASRGGSLLALLALVLVAAGAAVAATKVALRRSRYLSRDPRRVATACRRELSEYLLDQRIEAARSATLHELGRLVRDELAVDPTAFVAAASAARFGPPAGAAVAARAARRELRQLERLLHARLTPYERLRGLLSLRSLGVVSAS